MENGKWGKTAIKKVAAPAYASSLRCRILKCPCELSTGFSPHNPAKKPVRRGGRPDPDGGGVSMSSLTTRGMDPRMLYGVVVIILAVVVVVVVVAIGTVLLFRLVLALLYYNSALSIPYQIWMNRLPPFSFLVVSFGDFMQRLPFVVYHLPLHIVVTS